MPRRRSPIEMLAGGSAPRAEEPVCRLRGYCGPFVNQAYYNSLEQWAGFGICVECGSTVPVPRENARALDRWLRGEDLPVPPPRLE